MTRPPRISGAPVCWATRVTGRPASASAAAVPPLESSRKPLASNPSARGTNPRLSDTLKRAVGAMAAEWGTQGPTYAAVATP